MAQTKTAKWKEMFKPYDADGVPDTMPFPELCADLPGLSGNEAMTFYERVKNNAFEAKAFQHKVQAQDCAEEARLPALVAAWKQKQKEKKGILAAVEDHWRQVSQGGGTAVGERRSSIMGGGTSEQGRCQMLVASGFKHMIDTLHASDNFRPFVATMLMGWLSEEGQVQYEW
ncbi:hypothetical protein B0H17DRAFT_1133299 [Mycena rosella]|uniref:Uncharacterized protein n=1 Tax=Mycena rosella TaxID=1033263 RepID=A0AAD7DIY4_MYCRO|nr:hypothetical protein B0H17DRAFT_1133299 [Mycena rosella]